jgi:protease I
MGTQLQDKKIAFLVAGSGVEQVELTTPWQAVVDSAGAPTLVAPHAGVVQAFHHDVEKADEVTADLAIKEADEADFDALVLPGGTTNADRLRLVPEAVELVSRFVRAGKPVAAICHGPWALVEADVLHGKILTSFPSLRTDITNAGGTWVDKEVCVCTDEGWPLVTSRKPDDLEAFCAAMVTEFSAPPQPSPPRS